MSEIETKAGCTGSEVKWTVMFVHQQWDQCSVTLLHYVMSHFARPNVCPATTFCAKSPSLRVSNCVQFPWLSSTGGDG